TPAALAASFGPGTFRPDSGHNEWVDANVHHSGFTATFPPNTRVPSAVGGRSYDVDFTSVREGESATLPTYAAVTSRSHHPGGVNAVLMDGSVRFVRDAVGPSVWRALATRAGGEVIGDY
ncbi:MAG: H-X9-DG-CTERM domain-containing protein, partial [Gemmataceae bacterium]